MQVFVLLFNARTENEGIHTLKVDDRNVVLMFEAEDDAIRYGMLLEAQDFVSPTVERFEAEEIEEFCQSADYECKLVSEGMLAIPPESNVDMTDWQLEPQNSQQNSQSPTSQQSNSPSQPSDSSGEFTDAELERMRRKLEGLL
jgi:hypothetical protein